jgi:hypothetical protein
MENVVAPLDQEYELPDDEINVTDPPPQKVVLPLGVIVAVGNGLSITDVADDEAEHPFALVTITK